MDSESVINAMGRQETRDLRGILASILIAMGLWGFLIIGTLGFILKVLR